MAAAVQQIVPMGVVFSAPFAFSQTEQALAFEFLGYGPILGREVRQIGRMSNPAH
jgi:hypothetical protein